MKINLNLNARTFTPQLYKSFPGALKAFFTEECPQIGGLRTRQVLVHSICSMIDSFFPATNNLRSGQTIWSAVHKNEQSSYGKTINKSRLTPVILDLLPAEEIKARSEGARLRVILSRKLQHVSSNKPTIRMEFLPTQKLHCFWKSLQPPLALMLRNGS